MVVTGSPPAAVVRVLRRIAVRRPHVLLVPVPGATGVRLAAERLLRERGWPLADSPAVADILLVCGQPGRSLAEAVDQLWRQVPGPRARARVASPDQVAAELDRAVGQLAQPGAQRRDAVDRPPADTAPDDTAPDDMGSDDMGTHDDAGMDMGSGDDTGMDMGSEDDAGMDMGDMDMPAGLMMADRGEDRDGLKLDQLHVQLGPVLPDWPAGLVLHVVVQGDVIQQADLDLGPVEQTAVGEPFWDRPPLATGSLGRDLARRRTAAAHLDSAHRLLAIAGWEDASSTAAVLRDELLDDRDSRADQGDRVGQRVARFARRVGRSRTLRWSTRGLGVLSRDDAMATGIGGPALRAAGDVHDRLTRWLSEAAGALQRTDADDHAHEGSRGQRRPDGATRADRAPSRALAEVIPSLVTGLDIAGARLVIASLDPDTDELAWAATREPVDA